MIYKIKELKNPKNWLYKVHLIYYTRTLYNVESYKTMRFFGSSK